MRCVITLKDGNAMERATRALAKYRYHARGERVAPEGYPKQWSNWFLEIDMAELETIRDHVEEGDIVEMKPVSEPASSKLH
jgi:hypothetical protein